MPCRKAMPFLNNCEQNIKQRGCFIYISDKEFDKWKWHPKRRFILDKNNFMALNYQICCFTKKCN
jgi:hypothetical protein